MRARCSRTSSPKDAVCSRSAKPPARTRTTFRLQRSPRQSRSRVRECGVAIGPPPSRQAGMTEAFAASVHALELADNAAMLKAMGRGELEAPVREDARAEA